MLAQAVPQLLSQSGDPHAISASGALTSFSNSAPPLREDYPKIKFWTRHSWTAANKKANDSTTVQRKAAERGGTRMANDENVTMRFVEDAEGVAIGGRRAQDIRRRMRGIFWHLADQPGGPASTWTGYAGIKQQYYYQDMGKAFPELRLCELDWKADKLAIDGYPSWYQTYLKKEPERIKQDVKEEGLENVARASVPVKRSHSPLVSSTQKKKAKRMAAASTTAPSPPSALATPPSPSAASAEASSAIASSSPSTAPLSLTGSQSPETTAASNTPPPTANGPIRDSEGLVTVMHDTNNGVGMDKQQEKDSRTVAAQPQLKVCLR